MRETLLAALLPKLLFNLTFLLFLSFHTLIFFSFGHMALGIGKEAHDFICTNGSEELCDSQIVSASFESNVHLTGFWFEVLFVSEYFNNL